MLNNNPYSYVNELTKLLRDMRACRYEAHVLYASDKKMIFDIDTIVEDLGMFYEQFNETIAMMVSLRPKLNDYLLQNGIDIKTKYLLDPKIIELTETFLKEMTPYTKTQLLADKILSIIRSDEFKEHLNFNTD